MPRRSRIDAPGALQHIIARGIERRAIFRNNADQDDFIDRLGKVLHDTGTACYAWALVTNHVHLLLRTGATSISTVMRRLLTGYAVSFNQRHRRYGHLFQNRYKSILCEEASYLKQLVAYIHLNPFRAGIVNSVQALQTYPFTGHCALMGRQEVMWQDTDYVLALFGKNITVARRRYTDYVLKWAAAGRHPELTGGGLIRSAGGWRAVKAAQQEGMRLSSDERILGSSDFVTKTLATVGEDYDRHMKLKSSGVDLGAVMEAVCTHLEVSAKDLTSACRMPLICHARALISYLAVKALRFSGAEVARQMDVDRSSVSRAIARVQKNPALKNMADKVLCQLYPAD